MVVLFYLNNMKNNILTFKIFEIIYIINNYITINKFQMNNNMMRIKYNKRNKII